MLISELQPSAFAYYVLLQLRVLKSHNSHSTLDHQVSYTLFRAQYLSFLRQSHFYSPANALYHLKDDQATQIRCILSSLFDR